MSKQVLPSEDAESILDHLCWRCKSIFDSEVIQLLVERPEDTYHIKEHILCGDLPISARKCHLCSWILASCGRADLEAIDEWAGADEDSAGTENVNIEPFPAKMLFLETLRRRESN